MMFVASTNMVLLGLTIEELKAISDSLTGYETGLNDLDSIQLKIKGSIDTLLEELGQEVD